MNNTTTPLLHDFGELNGHILKDLSSGASDGADSAIKNISSHIIALMQEKRERRSTLYALLPFFDCFKSILNRFTYFKSIFAEASADAQIIRHLSPGTKDKNILLNVLTESTGLMEGTKAVNADSRAWRRQLDRITAALVEYNNKIDDKNTLNREWNYLQEVQSPALYQARQFLELFYKNMLKDGSRKEHLRTSAKKLEKLDTYFKDSRQLDGFTDLKNEIFLRHLLHAQKNTSKENFIDRLMALPASQKLFLRDILNNIITNALVNHSIHGHPRDLVSREHIELLKLIESNDATCKEFIRSGMHPITKSWASVQNQGFATISACMTARAREDIAGIAEPLRSLLNNRVSLLDIAEIETLLFKKTLSKEEEKKLNKALPLISYARQNLLDIRLSPVGRRWHNDMLQSPDNWPDGLAYRLFQQFLQIDKLRSPKIDQAQLNFICTEHDKNGGEHPLSVAVEGAGPSGLLTAITQFHKGAHVHVFEERDTGYDRAQIVRLDPLWMHTLKFYLGEKYFSLFGVKAGRGGAAEDGFGEIVTANLEDALHARFSELNSMVNNDNKLSRLALHRLDSLEPPREEGGKYTVKAVFNTRKDKHLGYKAVDEDRKTVEKEIDMLICAGGKNSTLTKKYFNQQMVTNKRDYGVSSWESNKKTKVTNNALDTFPDFRNMLVCKADFLQNVKDHFNSAIKKVPLKPEGETEETSVQAREQIDNGLKGIAWEDTFNSVTGMVLQTRTFENKGLIYIGMEIPEEIADLGDDIEQKLIGVDAAYAGGAKKLFHQAWFQAVGKYYGLEEKGVSDNTMRRGFTAMFPVTQHRLEKNVVVETSANGARVIITAAGDAKASPHFMRYSGLTGAREHISSLSRLTEGLFLDPENRDRLIEELEQEDQRTADFVIGRGQPFLDAARPTIGTEL